MKLKKIKLVSIILFIILVASVLGVIYFPPIEYKAIGSEVYSPQINRAVIQITEILPELESAESTLRDCYQNIETNRKQFLSYRQIDENREYKTEIESIDELVDETLSWTDRITCLKIGESGGAFVIQNDGTIIAHRDQELVGKKMDLFDKDYPVLGNVVDFNELRDDPEKVKDAITSEFITPLMDIDGTFDYLEVCYFGTVIKYGEYYIICGVSLEEFRQYILVLAMSMWIGVAVAFWIMFRYINMYMSKKEGNVREITLRFVSVALVIVLVTFVVVLYNRTLFSVTNNLECIQSDSALAVKTAKDYQKKREKIDEWLDGQYLIQCHIAADIVKTEGKENITRQQLQEYADELDVKEIFVFDRDGNVVVTNSPYDHFKLSEDEDDQSYAFRVLLEGAEYVVQEPMKNEVMGEYYQYIGVSIRDENDLADGFVQIAVDPTIRDELKSTLEVDDVIRNLQVGVTENALAVDKKKMTIDSTTGLGYKGEKVSDIGINEKDLIDGVAGFLNIQGESYYAGCSESADNYFITVLDRDTGFVGVDALIKTLFISLALMLLMILPGYRYMKKTFIEQEEEVEEEDFMEAYATGEGSIKAEKVIDKVEENEDKTGLLDKIKEKIHTTSKPRFDARWNIDTTPISEQTPEQRLMRVIFHILFLLCVFIILPEMFGSLSAKGAIGSVGGFSYGASNAWQRGVNIFALSACIELVCSMFVIVTILNRILYHIAKVSSMRVETICMLIRNSLKYICFVILVFYWLAQFGVKTTTLLASAGIISVVIGIGAKDLVNDIIAGFFIIFEGSFKVGDWVKVGDWIGMIREIGIRTTKVEFFSDTMVFNNSSMKDVAVTDGPITYLRINIPVSYSIDLEWLEGILEKELPIIVEKLPMVTRAKYQGIDKFTSNAMIIRIYIFTVSYKRGPAMRQFNREIKLMLDRYGIEIPVNQVNIQFPEEEN